MTESITDLELARSAHNGDEAAFAEIVRRYSRRVFYVASRFYREQSLAEEAAQETFLRAYTRLGDYTGEGSFEGWLTRIATTTCLNLIRNSQRRPEATAGSLSEEEADWLHSQMANVAMERHQAAEHSRTAVDLADRVLSTMSADDRVALLLVDGEEMPIKQVAEMTGWSESKVKVQAFRARRRMREAVEKLIGGRKEKFVKEKR